MIKNPTVFAGNFQRYFLMSVLVMLLVLLTIFVSPFGIDLIIAGVIVMAVYPANAWLMRKIPFSKSLSAFISMFLIIIILLIPFTLFGFFVSQEGVEAYRVVSGHINVIVSTNDVSSTSKILQLLPFHTQFEKLMNYLPVSTSDLLQTFKNVIGTASSFLISQTTNILKNLSVLLVHLLIFLIALFYFLRDGDRFVLYIRSLLPMSKTYSQELFLKLSNLSHGIIYGIFGASILQGFLVGVGFAVAGISNAAFWGAVAALFSPLPYIGTTVIWMPAVIVLALEGHYIAAGLLMAWSAFIVGTADNIIKPYIIGSSAKLHPLATLLVLLGGTFVFGLKGIIFGPLVLTLTLAFMHIYQLEYKAALEQDEVKEKVVAVSVRKKT